MFRWTCISLLVSALAGMPVLAANGQGAKPTLWLAPLDSKLAPRGTGSLDFDELFSPGNPWPAELKRISVFKFYPEYVSRVSDEELSQAIKILSDRGIALALEARVLDDQARCGSDGGEATAAILRKIKKAGGTVTYLAMDEPLHHWRKRGGCHSTLEELASDISRKVGEFRQIFPALSVGDVEPIGKWASAEILLSATEKWLDAYRKASGQKLAFLHADVGWGTDWVGITTELMKFTQQKGIRFGMIYNGEDLAHSDSEWANEAISHFETFERGGRQPDDVIFQSWVSHPKHILPESDGSSMSGIVQRYLEDHKSTN